MIELEASSGIWRFREAGVRTWSSESRKAKVREEEGEEEEERCSFLEARIRDIDGGKLGADKEIEKRRRRRPRGGDRD